MPSNGKSSSAHDRNPPSYLQKNGIFERESHQVTQHMSNKYLALLPPLKPDSPEEQLDGSADSSATAPKLVELPPAAASPEPQVGPRETGLVQRARERATIREHKAAELDLLRQAEQRMAANPILWALSTAVSPLSS